MHAFDSILSMRSLRRCKLHSTLHWLQYSTAPNAMTLYSKISHKNKIVFLQIFRACIPRKRLHNHNKVCINNLRPVVPLLNKDFLCATDRVLCRGDPFGIPLFKSPRACLV